MTLAKHTEKYKGHYIVIKIKNDGFADDSDQVQAAVAVWDGAPPSQVIFESLVGDRVKSFNKKVPRYNSEDDIEELIEEAKGYIDTQKTNEFAANESMQIAVERQFNDSQ